MKKILYILFVAAVLLFASCSVREQPETVYAESEQRLMQRFFIAKTENKQLKEDIQFEYDSLNRRFTFETQRWIDGIDSLRPTFFADGEAYIEDVEQLPGITSCNFSKREVEYVVRNTRQMTQQKCTVSIVSPQTTGLPILRIDIAGGKTVEDKETYLPATYVLSTADSTLMGTLEIRGRGNSTWWQKKKPYRIKLTESVSLFGMHKARSWVLLANALDASLITNTVGLELARRMELPCTNHGQHVELYINGAYAGNYFLTEQIQVHKGRVEADTLKGGFLVELDLNYDEQFQFKTPIYKVPVMLKQPENSSAMNEVRTIFVEIERLLAQSNPDYDKLSALIDMPSLARYMLLNDLVYNGEFGHPKSVYCFCRSREVPIEWGPAWDYDWAFGYVGTQYVYFQNADNLMFDLTRNPLQLGGAGGNFFSRFFRIPEFRELYKQEWQRVLPAVSDIDNYVWQQGRQLEYSWLENHKRWGAPDIKKQYSYMDMMSFLDRRIEKITETTK
ncbi:MAG: CotH kinase family protein [Paludibacteraceae bacterium]|nr:CotH kinase family protein [Paludibacteraceae bacterium]